MAHRADPLNSTAGPSVTSTARTGRFLTLALIAALALVELLWLRWYLSEPLPNAGNVGGKLHRSLFLWRALPDVVPGVKLNESYVSLAASELSHVENLPQRAPIVLAALLIAAAAVAAGRLVLRLIRVQRLLTPWETLPLAFGLGSVALATATLAFGRLGLLAPWPARVGLGALIGIELAIALRDRLHREAASDDAAERLSVWWLGSLALVTGPFLVLMALGAMLPTIDYDASEYHLEGPKEYFLAGKITFLEHNVYTSMPFGVEMLHLLGMEVIGDWWWGALVGQLLVACFAPATAAMIALVLARYVSPRAAWVAAFVYLSTPWVYRLAAIPYVEGPLCYFHAALAWAAARAWTAQTVDRARLWGLAGLLAGGAMACKYPGLVSAVLPAGVVALIAAARSRSWVLPLVFGAGVALAIGPWMIKNMVDTSNPVYPLAYRVFGGSHWDAERDAKWAAIHGPRPVSSRAFVDGVLDVAGRSDWQSPLYTALAPLAFLRRGTRKLSLVLWAVVLYIFGTWFLLTHRLDRFWLPLLPAAAALAGIGADWISSRAWTAVLAFLLTVTMATSLMFDSTRLAGLNQWTEDLNALREAVPEMVNAPLAQLDASLPPGAKVLLVGQAGVFHFRHPVVYNTVFNHETIETLARGKPAAEVHAGLKRLGVDYVYVDWFEIERYRSPGNYGFTSFVTPQLFEKLVDERALEPPSQVGLRQQLFKVRAG